MDNGHMSRKRKSQDAFGDNAQQDQAVANTTDFKLVANLSMGSAVAKGNVQRLRSLLESRASANSLDGKGVPVIVNAAKNGNVEVLSLLLNHKAMVNLPPGLGSGPLCHAARANKADAVKLLLQHGADPFEKSKTVLGEFNTLSLACLCKSFESSLLLRRAVRELTPAGVWSNPAHRAQYSMMADSWFPSHPTPRVRPPLDSWLPAQSQWEEPSGRGQVALTHDALRELLVTRFKFALPDKLWDLTLEYLMGVCTTCHNSPKWFTMGCMVCERGLCEHCREVSSRCNGTFQHYLVCNSPACKEAAMVVKCGWCRSACIRQWDALPHSFVDKEVPPMDRTEVTAFGCMWFCSNCFMTAPTCDHCGALYENVPDPASGRAHIHHCAPCDTFACSAECFSLCHKPHT